jgi:aspartate/glutamate racemase
MKFKRTIGLIGGLGPFAGAYALNRLFEMAASDYGCEEDEDFPEIIEAFRDESDPEGLSHSRAA